MSLDANSRDLVASVFSDGENSANYDERYKRQNCECDASVLANGAGATTVETVHVSSPRILAVSAQVEVRGRGATGLVSTVVRLSSVHASGAVRVHAGVHIGVELTRFR